MLPFSMTGLEKDHTRGVLILANAHRRSERSRTASCAGPAVLFGGLITANIVAWAWAFALFADRPVVMATALLAWVFGLRHAVDADHIAAIDNVVRSLMQAGGTPRSAGLYFALGHSSVVVVATMLLALGVVSLGGDGLLKEIGSFIGASVSALFLLVIAAINLAIFASLWRTFRKAREQGIRDAAGLDALLAHRGILVRLLGPMFRLVTKPWHMYPLGFLFGLGFDTATEIGLLSISASEAARGASLADVMVLPALFAAGMALVDTADSTLMVSAYRWAFVDPMRKLWYNLTITGASVAVALFIGGIEALGLIGNRLDLSGGVWTLVDALNESLANVGLAVIALFAIAWLLSIVLYRRLIAGSSGPADTEVLECADATEAV
ncbi:HoxN/HupN/NixA family nickel/cobalt transporter [Bradyrhizobium diazoefficiens]|uniref:HoxN/HupN/NixA family nickel/cobalt transporter n=1 Tax=Bradyrhizobium TaxID=374 RepID=UPI0004570ED3|nr:HoxN/HupN/NixA family nickel/cobalt transporter [Bradyrhizobium diazoefficiens]MCD9293546.1 HoxN/HupN/NixA family nickel/cobalt transporter [Bradyrhizobium diazoefficiens]MCD9808548.1 HoxN/HupN/NixA family nickel/cobalt transporter [Bradyrhizobium diazoefficiens]MCD9827336.1 HoxN/HupN/NixA family nickel/cobalt transporter [Bradyrhizobium diazoefficiens]MCD9845693.1 HoxN/HupN/NixA family nickel/cobalt transporter [Bradyrhizobium diazoefficiens]MCD9884585.1 HoxN/HupN/NixA family nickel/cobalt